MIVALDIITSAAILFIVSAGLLVVFGVMRIINFAHGALITLGAYGGLLGSQAGLDPILSAAVAFAVGAMAGAFIEFCAMRLLYHRPLDAILATWGLGIVIGQIITLVFGREIQFVQSPMTGTMPVFGDTYSIYRLLLVLAALAIFFVFTVLLNATRLGLVTRAVIMNDALARSLGLNSSAVRFATFSIGCGLAALAGSLITPLTSVDPNMGIPWLLNAFMLVMVSGGSLASLAIACLVLGGAQVVVSIFVSPILGGLTIVVLAALVLRIRPEGFASA